MAYRGKNINKTILLVTLIIFILLVYFIYLTKITSTKHFQKVRIFIHFLLFGFYTQPFQIYQYNINRPAVPLQRYFS